MVIENSPNKVKLMVSLRRREFKKNLRTKTGEKIYMYQDEIT